MILLSCFRKLERNKHCTSNNHTMKPKAVNDLITNTVQGIILSLTEKPIKPTYLGYVKESHCCIFYFKFLEQKGCKGVISTFGMD